MAHLVIVYHSGFGHTKVQADHVLKGVQSVPGVTVQMITAEEALKDQSPFTPADCIIFGCPTYMGGAAAKFKEFIDACGQIWFRQEWKDKLAAGFTNSQGLSGDKLSTLTQLMINAMQHGMVWVGTGFIPGAEGTAGTEHELNRLSSFMGAMAQSPYGSAEPLNADLVTAEKFGARVAQAALRWVRGKSA